MENKLALCYVLGALIGGGATAFVAFQYPDRVDAIPAGLLMAVSGTLSVWGMSDGGLFDKEETAP